MVLGMLIRDMIEAMALGVYLFCIRSGKRSLARAGPSGMIAPRLRIWSSKDVSMMAAMKTMLFLVDNRVQVFQFETSVDHVACGKRNRGCGYRQSLG